MNPHRLRLLAGFLLGIAGGANADILAEHALLDQVQALRESARAGDTPLRCGTPLVVEARHTIQNPALNPQGRARQALALIRD